MACCSSLTFPGQWYFSNLFIADSLISFSALLYFLQYIQRKCSTKRGISSVLFLRGGRFISTVFILYNKSCLKRFSDISSSIGIFVAQTNLISIGFAIFEPSLVTVLFWSTERSFIWRLNDKFPISSRNKVPPEAISNRPALSSFASVNAPLTYPNNSLSKSDSLIAPISTFKKISSALLDWRWTALATNSFPVPFSPSIRIFASVCATFWIVLNTFCISSDTPIIL